MIEYMIKAVLVWALAVWVLQIASKIVNSIPSPKRNLHAIDSMPPCNCYLCRKERNHIYDVTPEVIQHTPPPIPIITPSSALRWNDETPLSDSVLPNIHTQHSAVCIIQNHPYHVNIAELCNCAYKQYNIELRDVYMKPINIKSGNSIYTFERPMDEYQYRLWLYMVFLKANKAGGDPALASLFKNEYDRISSKFNTASNK